MVFLRKVTRNFKRLSPRRWLQTKTAPVSVQEVTPIFRRATEFPPESVALRDDGGDYSYRGLFLSSKQLAGEISARVEGRKQERVAFLCRNDASYIIAQWACWMSGQIAVPLSALHPPPLLEYFINDSDAAVLLASSEHAELLHSVKGQRAFLELDPTLRSLAQRKPEQVGSRNPTVQKGVELGHGGLENRFYGAADAMIIYTSGTTSKPKGVVMSHSNIDAQVSSLVTAWGWTSKDSILHTLPLNHIHGIVNALLTPLSIGARVVMLPKFDTSAVWSQILALNATAGERINIYTGVPTMYARLIDEYDKMFGSNERMKEYIHSVCSQKIRLMMSGSAPLPVPVLERWESITGHRLLERYGMTETGMILSNPLHGERRPGFVGQPLPGVKVRLSEKGEVQVKGDGVFTHYWKRPQATAKSFTDDGWFMTGDTAEIQDGSYHLLGRTSVDVIKTGGYKVGAVTVETALLGHPNIADCAVVGLPDITWGQKIAAVVVLHDETNPLTLPKLREWAKAHLAPYSVPTQLKIVKEIPRNTMGKVNKNDLVKVFNEGESPTEK